MIDLLTDSTPNGFKISIALEELGLDYDWRNIDFSVNEQKSPEIMALNPNGKIPIVIDRENDDLVLWESGAILLYLAEKTGQLMPTAPIARAKAQQWLMWQMAGLGPMLGQLLVFAIPFENRMPDATARYQKEGDRLFRVLNDQLEGREYIVDDHSIVDIACYPWVALAFMRAGFDKDAYPNVAAWFDHCSDRPAYQKGMAVPGDKPDEQRMKGFFGATIGVGS